MDLDFELHDIKHIVKNNSNLMEMDVVKIS